MNAFYEKKYGMMKAYRDGNMSSEELCKRFLVIDRAFFRRFFKVYVFKLQMSPEEAITAINREYTTALAFVLTKLKHNFDHEQSLDYAFKSCKHAVMADIAKRTKILESDALVEIETMFVPVLDDVLAKKNIQKYICDRYADVKEGTTRYIVLKNIINCIFHGEFVPTAELSKQTTVSKQAVNLMHNEIVRELSRHLQGA